MFVHRATESSFVELRRVRSPSCCRTFVELLSECSLVELLFGTRNSRKNEPSERCRSKQSSEEAMEAMPKTIERTLSGSEMAPPFHRTRRISLNYCAAYFFRKDGICVALAYFFPGRVRRLFLPGTLQVRSKHVNDTVRYGNFFLTPTVVGVVRHIATQQHIGESPGNSITVYNPVKITS